MNNVIIEITYPGDDGLILGAEIDMVGSKWEYYVYHPDDNKPDERLLADSAGDAVEASLDLLRSWGVDV